MTQANYAYYHVTGPVHIYVRIPARGAGPFVGVPSLGGTILFLGHSEESPEPKQTAAYLDVKSSLAGPIIPDDKVYVGTEYTFDVKLSRFSWDVIQMLTAWPQYGRGAAPGSETYLDRGRLALANGDTFELWAKNSFYGTANSTAYPDLPPGYYYPGCILEHHYPQNLTRASSFATIRVKPMSVRQGITGGFFTYTQNPQYFVGLPDPG